MSEQAIDLASSTLLYTLALIAFIILVLTSSLAYATTAPRSWGEVEVLRYPQNITLGKIGTLIIAEGKGYATLVIVRPDGTLAFKVEGDLPLTAVVLDGDWAVAVSPYAWRVVKGSALLKDVYVAIYGLDDKPPKIKPYIRLFAGEYRVFPEERMWVKGKPVA